eukprot:8673756-Karenia_brevis.AAC.1
MGLPRHCVRDVGTDVAKSRFGGFTDMGGGPLPMGSTVLHAKMSVPMSVNVGSMGAPTFGEAQMS